MPRDIPVGNGSLLVNFDARYRLRDLYWPYVGQENHTVGHVFRFGVWADGEFRWLADEGWERTLNYADNTLVTSVTLHHPDLALTLECQDAVDFHENLYLRQVVVRDEAGRDREVRLFFGQDFHISGRQVGDTAYYEPERKAVFHYKGQRWFMMNTAKANPGDDGPEWLLGVDQWAVGKKEVPGKAGTWVDAEDGTLSGNAVVQGSVDSALALHLQVPANGEGVGWYWIAVGEQFTEVTRINRQVRRKGPDVFLARTRDYWKLWVNKENRKFPNVSESLLHLYRRSLMILRTQIDANGAILAANDFSIVRYGRDTYSYMWPRDGALVAAALIEAGYSEITRHFFDFCHEVITEEGYLLHKFNPDGSLGSSWHGWYYEGAKRLPVQEDETALVLWALWRHFDRFRDIEFVKPHYRGLVTRAADWLVAFRDEETGMPLPSWDLWEETRGVHAWTVGATCGGLLAAANFSEAFGEQSLAKKYRRAVREISNGAHELLWLPERECFAATIQRQPDGSWKPDPTLDASLVGLWRFGAFAPDEPCIVDTMHRLREVLWVQTDIGGMARYEGDDYHRASDDREAVPGNPWFISTLWLAQWHIAVGELEKARELLEWAARHALRSGVMAEQVHPHTGEPLSVSPLTWSHGEYVTTFLQYVAAHASATATSQS